MPRCGGRLGAVALSVLLLGGCSEASDRAPDAGGLPPPILALPTRMPTPLADTPAPDLGAAPGPSATAPADPAGAAPVVTPPPAPPDWTFAVVGDTWKDTPMLRQILAGAASAPDDLLVDLGDLTPQGRPEQLAAFAQLARGAGLPVYAVPGNHDVAWSHATAPFERYWPRHQGFDHRDAHFTIVDTSAVTLDAAELAWVEQDLAATQKPLKFVFMHVPPFMPYPVPSESALQAGGPAFVALMEKYHVTTVFAGHLHAYTRVDRGGTSYVITGGGGEPLHVPALLGGRYHYVRVAVQGSEASIAVIPLDGVPTPAP